MREFKSIEGKIIDWHHDRNLIDGATDWSQTDKLLEEFIELMASQMPDSEPESIVDVLIAKIGKLLKGGRIKPVGAYKAKREKIDAIGDMAVVMINIAERNGSSLETCMNQAYDEIKHRKGKMIDGQYIKESDL